GHDVDRIVVGLPLHTGGGESESSAQARRWGAWLADVTGLPVVFFDERYTSVDAEDVLRSAGVKLRKRKDKRDMLAARLLLQNYLDAGSPVEERPPSSLIDGPTAGGRREDGDVS
ncbi:Holliday junction resolvase RuvX, partial [Escherichia coli]|uniref:Holliday junction resolvase RuvX n=1 Tax=Escherichia coli TaxID=562 RepID=UPI001582FA48